jgi:hypothetical protein
VFKFPSGHTAEDQKIRNEFAFALMNAAPSSAFKHWQILSNFRLVNEVGVQEKWIKGDMSNFDYLMALNTISGRSFNDLCQVASVATSCPINHKICVYIYLI